MTTLDFTPSRLDQSFYAGDDTSLRFFFSSDAPVGSSYVGSWVSTDPYLVNQIVEYSSTFYVSLKASTNVTPGTDPTTWNAITPFDLTGYTAWAAQIRSSDTEAVPFTVDATSQASSIILLSVAGTVLTAQQSAGVQSWDLQVTDPNGDIRTLFGGTVTISQDATRP